MRSLNKYSLLKVELKDYFEISKIEEYELGVGIELRMKM